tara:strand:- start:284 stop:886 length:603 start_codon:yes stop_codon:yes gene_type:complete
MTRRINCNLCKKPISTCFCKNVIPQQNKTKILILQHPEEEGHYLNTAIMAKLTFKHCHILTGVDFLEDNFLRLSLKKAKNPLLLFPKINTEETSEYNTLSPKNEYDLIILIDGPWRNAKQIYRQTKTLHELKRIELNLDHPKLYKIRKSEKDHFYSTFEAITYSLELIENKSFSSALELLKKQVDFHIECMGEKYQKYYL